MSGLQPLPEPREDQPITPREEGRVRAIEGILRTKVGQRRSRAGARALQELRGHPIAPTSARPMHAGERGASSSGRFKRLRWQAVLPWVAGVAAVALIGCGLLWMTQTDVTRQATLRVADVRGDVQIVTEKGSVPARHNGFLYPGQKVVTRSDSGARLTYRDGTAINMPGDATLQVPVDARANGSKQLFLSHGVFIANVKPQPRGHTMKLTTPSAQVEVLGTKFTISAGEMSTDLDVDHGEVRFTRSSDSKSIQVATGQTATVKPDTELVARPLQFVRGINLGGRAVTIDGRKWLSYKQALAEGLVVPRLSVWDWKKWKPNTPVDADTLEVLQTGIYTNEHVRDDPFVLTQLIPNGYYKVYVWTIENVSSGFRCFTVRLNEKTVATGVGVLNVGEWGKYGPYPVQVTDGRIKLEITGPKLGNTERHLNAIEIFKVGE